MYAIRSYYVLKSLGKLTLEQYASIMLESYLAISLMVSPHPSYPPLEMSTFGVKTITNSYSNKDLGKFNENIISISNCSASAIADELIKQCSQFNSNGKVCVNDDYLNSERNNFV